MKKIRYIALFWLFCQTLLAVNSLAQEKWNQAMNIQHFKATFTQTKQAPYIKDAWHALGNIRIENDTTFYFEYTQPTAYVLSITGNEVYVLSGQKETKTTLQQNRIATMIKSLVGSDSIPFDKTLVAEPGKSSNLYKWELTPNRRDLKRFVSKVVLSINPNESYFSTIVIVSAQQETTTIQIKQVSE